MIKITDYDSLNFNSGTVLDNAYDVKVTREINGEYMLEFNHPLDEKSEFISENKVIVCEGQAFRIMKITKTLGEMSCISVECKHIFNADAVCIHIQNVSDMIGKSPTEILKQVLSGTKFSVFSDSELDALGMRRVDCDGFKIDFFSVDKTNPYDIVQSIIECCGKGEVYVDNCKIAIVERIGSESAIRLDLSKNMKDISVERNINDMVTKLYPYGKDDAHIGSVNSGKQYILSDNAEKYGIREGYRDYSDYIEPKTILSRAMWEFDSDNEERIDVPCVNITGNYTDISKLADYADEKISIGDSVTVIDNGNEIKERVIRLEYYPYQNNDTVVSIGRVKKDLFFYLEQMGKLAKSYKKTTTYNGMVRAAAVSGVISQSGVRIDGDNGTVAMLSDVIEISNGNEMKTQIGNVGGEFVFNINDNNGDSAINISANGEMNFKGEVTASSVSVGDCVISQDEKGDLCINGKKIVLEGGE